MDVKKETGAKSPHRLWAEFRYSVIGQLLASPAGEGKLAPQIRLLAQKTWCHPITGRDKYFKFSTIEGWYYAARNEKADPVARLRSKPRSDIGKSRRIIDGVADLLLRQYARFPYWCYQLHTDNLRVQIENQDLGAPPSYPTVRRYMKGLGFFKRKKPRNPTGAAEVLNQNETLETRSFEVEYVNGLWHLDFHKNPMKVLIANGSWESAILLGIFDDHSRLCCHMQWYLAETTDCLVHGFCQALAKRQIPRELLNDNGGAMTSAEFTEGLARLGIEANCTRPRTPKQNGKCEFVWNRVEGRLMAMLDGQTSLTLKQLNDITQAWVEMEYNRVVHDETKQRPIDRFASGKDVGRPCPSSETLRFYFMREVTRTQRRSDGTVSLDGHRYEIPSRFRHLEKLTLKYAVWDMSHVHLVDFRTGDSMGRIYPVDKAKNADGRRRTMENPVLVDVAPLDCELPALLRRLMDDHAAIGMPAYLPKDDSNNTQKADEHDAQQ